MRLSFGTFDTVLSESPATGVEEEGLTREEWEDVTDADWEDSDAVVVDLLDSCNGK